MILSNRFKSLKQRLSLLLSETDDANCYSVSDSNNNSNYNSGDLLSNEKAALSHSKYVVSNNYERRVLYAEMELLKMDIESHYSIVFDPSDNIDISPRSMNVVNDTEEASSNSSLFKAVVTSPSNLSPFQMINTLNTMTSSLSLGMVQRKTTWWSKIDDLTRLICTWTTLITFAVFVALPVIVIIQPIDIVLIHRLKWIRPRYALSTAIKNCIGFYVLSVAGISLSIEYEDIDSNCINSESGLGLNHDNSTDDDSLSESKSMIHNSKDRFISSMENSKSLIAFSHSSSIDAFILSASVPVQNYAMSKSELFLIPFFNLLLTAFGGIAIERSVRDKAISALKYISSYILIGESISIAPEGTRSANGLLMEFKKGPFYLIQYLLSSLKTEEQIVSDNDSSSTSILLIPFVIYGAFDLFPPKSSLGNKCGLVHARFLSPMKVNNSDAACDLQRHKLSVELRRKMLQSHISSPKSAGDYLSWKERLICLSSLVSAIITDYLIYNKIKIYLNNYNLLFGFIFVSIATIAMYILIVKCNSYKCCNRNVLFGVK